LPNVCDDDGKQRILPQPIDFRQANRLKKPIKNAVELMKHIAPDKYPYWSSWVLRPFSLVPKQCVGLDDQLSHDSCDCQLLAFSG
jgi:hypothetical protein